MSSKYAGSNHSGTDRLAGHHVIWLRLVNRPGHLGVFAERFVNSGRVAIVVQSVGGIIPSQIGNNPLVGVRDIVLEVRSVGVWVDNLLNDIFTSEILCEVCKIRINFKRCMISILGTMTIDIGNFARL